MKTRNQKSAVIGTLIATIVLLMLLLGGCAKLAGTAKPNPKLAAEYLAKGQQLETQGDLAAAMEQSSTNTSMVAAAAEEMTATINEIAQNAEKARIISDQAVQKAQSANSQMDGMGKAAQGIGKVVETITEISEQVNLLAQIGRAHV